MLSHQKTTSPSQSVQTPTRPAVFVTSHYSSRPTVPARDSVEEAWLLDVQRGARSLGDVIRDAERRRDLQRLSVARLLGGMS